VDPLVGLVGAFVIASWSYALVRDTGAILLDMNPDRSMADKLQQVIEGEGDRIDDLHLWRTGPPWGDCVREHTSGARTGLLSGKAGTVPFAIASHH
jgi:hypothetical protein